MLDIEDVRDVLRTYASPISYNIPTVTRFALEELLEYKETGLTPDEIKYAKESMRLELETGVKKMLEINVDTETIKFVMDVCTSEKRTLNQHKILVYNCLKELLEYRETELTPDKIREMDKLYLEKCQEVNSLVATCEKLERRK